MRRLSVRPFSLLALAASAGMAAAQDATNDFFAAPFVDGSPQWVSFVNDLVGWRPYANAGFLGSSTVVGNIEAGHIWSGHEVFVRNPAVTNGFITYSNAHALNELDFHATMVGHVLAGSGYSAAGYSLLGIGMAPEATVLSGGIATSFSTNNLGRFTTSYSSIVTPYRAFMTGEGVPRADVINSSWGGADPAAASLEPLALDGLAAQNPNCALVVSAGNDGAEQVGWPGSGYNTIAVGALGGSAFLSPSDFTSRGLVDFYNPATGMVTSNARVAVDIAAPGEHLYLAAYLGNQGGLAAALPGLVQQPSPTNLYFVDVPGTSFASPTVAGGVAVLKDVANRDSVWNLNTQTNAKDTRVVKSVLMAGALETFGWNNAQTVGTNGALVTTQALDAATGAGALDMGRAGDAYFFGTRDMAGTNGGTILASGWDFGTVGVGTNNDYVFAGSFVQPVELTVSLNWFAGRSFDMETNLGSDLSFADLNLEVWELAGSEFATLVASSATDYNNAEYLRLDLLAGTTYGLRVTFEGMVFDQTSGVTSESYGLAWLAAPYTTLYWDPNGTNASVPASPSGLWDGLAKNFNTSPDGGAGTVGAITTGLNVLVFSAGTNATNNGTITVSGPQMSRGLVLEEGAPVFAGTNDAMIEVQTEGIRVAATVRSNAVFASSLSLYLGGNQTWSNASTHELVISSTVTGVGDLALEAGSSGAIRISGPLGQAGTVANRGTGSATNFIGGVIGTNVTALYQQSASSRLVLSASNAFAGSVHVEAGTLELSGAGGALAHASSAAVAAGATLLLSSGGQLNDSAAITLSGGTILRGSGVSEVFGNLDLTEASFLDFGAGAPGSLAFGAYTPGALLTVNNFFAGNSLVFSSDLSASIGNGSLFSFSGDFESAWSGGVFTITAVPEPSALCAACLLAIGFALALLRRPDARPRRSASR